MTISGLIKHNYKNAFILLYMLYKMELVYFLNYNFILFQAHHADLSMMEKLDQIPEWK